MTSRHSAKWTSRTLAVAMTLMVAVTACADTTDEPGDSPGISSSETEPAPETAVASSESGSADSDRGAGSAQRGGVLTQASAFNADSLDPHLSSLRARWYSVPFDSFFEYRLEEGSTDKFEIVPGLATSYELIDDTTVEFTLREGVTFHDGSEWNAEVAKWNIERARDHELSTVATTVENIQDVEVVDEYTVRLLLADPQPTLPIQLTPANELNVFLVSQEAVESMGDEAFAREPVGSGPMRVVNWVPDDRIEMERVDGHWATGVDGDPLPYLDEYVIRFITDQSVGAVEIRSGSVQLMEPLDQDVEQLANEPNIDVYAQPGSYTAQPSFYMTSNPDSSSPFAQDVRLRQALQHAVNRDAMASTLGFGRGEAHYYWGWYPGMPGYSESLPRYEYDPDRSRELLAEAGYGDGVDLEVKVINRPSDVQPLEVMQGMLGEVGIGLQITAIDRTPWVDAGRTGNFDALSHGNSSIIDPMLRQQSRTGSEYNWASYSNPEVDELWDRASAEQDSDERERIYHEMQTIMHEDAYHFIGFRRPLMLAHSTQLHGLETDYNLRYVWLGE